MAGRGNDEAILGTNVSGELWGYISGNAIREVKS
jgi:hypothetical protein